MKRPFRVRLFMTSRSRPRVRNFATEATACAFAVTEVKKALAGEDGAYEAIVDRFTNTVARYYIHNDVIRVVRDNKDVVFKG